MFPFVLGLRIVRRLHYVCGACRAFADTFLSKKARRRVAGCGGWLLRVVPLIAGLGRLYRGSCRRVGLRWSTPAPIWASTCIPKSSSVSWSTTSFTNPPVSPIARGPEQPPPFSPAGRSYQPITSNNAPTTRQTGRYRAVRAARNRLAEALKNAGSVWAADTVIGQSWCRYVRPNSAPIAPLS